MKSLHSYKGGEPSKLDGVSLQLFSLELASRLFEEALLGEEMELPLTECEDDKAPSPDGYEFSFNKVEWESSER